MQTKECVASTTMAFAFNACRLALAAEVPAAEHVQLQDMHCISVEDVLAA